MKYGTENKLKFKVLKRLLKMPLWQVKGILQSLWDFTAENAMHGDIRRFNDAQIAAGIEYDGDSVKLVHALVESGWLDRSRAHRLVVHDWEDHCEGWVMKRVKRSGRGFAKPDDKLRVAKSEKIENNELDLFAADNGGQRREIGDSGGLPTPTPTPVPMPITPLTPQGEQLAPDGAARAFDWKAGFLEFWAAYPDECPRKEAKAKCEDYYRQNVRSAGVHRALMRALERDKRSRDWSKDGGQYINAPLVWLRKKRWLDDPDEKPQAQETPAAAEACATMSDEQMEARQRSYLQGIGYQGAALEEEMASWRQVMADTP